jgi:hypothetical protein
MTNTYLTAHDYLKATTGQETASLVGNLCRLSTDVALVAGDQVYILDGSATELATVATDTAPGASAIPVQPLASGHLVHTSVVTDGTRGSLGDTIVEASAVVERITRQPLLKATVTEALPLMSTRASVDSEANLIIRPRQAPVVAVTSLQLQYTATNVVPLKADQAMIDAGGWLVRVPVISGASSTTLWNYASSTTPGQVLVGYTAGFDYGALPREIRRAAIMLVSDILADRLNPTGAAEVSVGKTHTVNFTRGDVVGQSALYKRAKGLLRAYTQGAF